MDTFTGSKRFFSDMEGRRDIFIILLVLFQSEISCGQKRHLRFIKIMEDKLSNLERRVDNSSGEVSYLHQELNIIKEVVNGIQTDVLSLGNKLGDKITSIEDNCDIVIRNNNVSSCFDVLMSTNSLKETVKQYKTYPANRTISNDQLRLVLETMITRSECAERQIKKLEHENVLLQKSLKEVSTKTDYTMSVTTGSEFNTESAQEDTHQTTMIPAMASMNRSRLFLAPNYQDIPQFYQMFLHNQSILNLKCGDLASKSILSVVFHPNINSLIIARGKPYYSVVSCSLDSDQVSVVKQETSAWGLTVDSLTQKILLSTHTPNKTISVVDVFGKNMRKMADLLGLPYGIAFDSTNRRTFITDYNNLMSLTSSGQVVKLDSGSEMRALAVDDKGKFLYYNDNTALKRRDFSGNETSHIAILPYIPWNFVYSDDASGNIVLYVSSFYDGRVGAVYLDENRTYVSLHEVTECRGVAICFVH